MCIQLNQLVSQNIYALHFCDFSKYYLICIIIQIKNFLNVTAAVGIQFKLKLEYIILSTAEIHQPQHINSFEEFVTESCTKIIDWSLRLISHLGFSPMRCFVNVVYM